MDKLRGILDAQGVLRAPPGKRPPDVARELWDRVVGPRIAARAEPYRLERGTLVVRVANAAWANELSLLAEPIVEQLAREGVDVTAIRFIVGEVAVSPPRTRGPAAVAAPVNPPVPREVAEQLGRVTSEPLREALRKAAAKSLALQSAAADRTTRSPWERRDDGAASSPPVSSDAQDGGRARLPSTSSDERDGTRTASHASSLGGRDGAPSSPHAPRHSEQRRPVRSEPRAHGSRGPSLERGSPTRTWADRAPESVVPPPETAAQADNKRKS